ncbi:MAG: hypothetical protein GY869_16965, partial [Planctomycetes bacterium]|nr:hypothetical protein [Planctomycetota bacterium]
EVYDTNLHGGLSGEFYEINNPIVFIWDGHWETGTKVVGDSYIYTVTIYDEVNIDGVGPPEITIIETLILEEDGTPPDQVQFLLPAENDSTARVSQTPVDVSGFVTPEQGNVFVEIFVDDDPVFDNPYDNIATPGAESTPSEPQGEFQIDEIGNFNALVSLVREDTNWVFAVTRDEVYNHSGEEHILLILNSVYVELNSISPNPFAPKLGAGIYDRTILSFNISQNSEVSLIIRDPGTNTILRSVVIDTLLSSYLNPHIFNWDGRVDNAHINSVFTNNSFTSTWRDSVVADGVYLFEIGADQTGGGADGIDDAVYIGLVKVDNTPPPAPNVVPLPLVAEQTSVPIEGTAEPGVYVRFYINTDSTSFNSETDLLGGETVADPINGVFSGSVSGLDVGLNFIYAVAIDSVQNQSDQDTFFTWYDIQYSPDPPLIYPYGPAYHWAQEVRVSENAITIVAPTEPLTFSPGLPGMASADYFYDQTGITFRIGQDSRVTICIFADRSPTPVVVDTIAADTLLTGSQNVEIEHVFQWLGTVRADLAGADLLFVDGSYPHQPGPQPDGIANDDRNYYWQIEATQFIDGVEGDTIIEQMPVVVDIIPPYPLFFTYPDSSLNFTTVPELTVYGLTEPEAEVTVIFDNDLDDLVPGVEQGTVAADELGIFEVTGTLQPGVNFFYAIATDAVANEDSIYFFNETVLDSIILSELIVDVLSTEPEI